MIKEHFDRCVISKFDGLSVDHPIIVLNSIKNILGDDKDEPSKILLNSLGVTSNQYPKRNDDQILLDQTVKEGIGLTVFISDLIESSEIHDYNKMEQEAARLHLVSENGLSGFEILIELALKDFNRLGELAYHLHRAMNFNKGKSEVWNYTRCLIKEIVKEKLSKKRENIETKFDLDKNIYNNQISTLTSAHRLWNLNSIRKSGFVQGISYWLSKQEVDSINVNNQDKVNLGLSKYVKSGGRYFIEIAEELIDSPKKIIELESLRYLSNNANPKHLSYISNRIMNLLQ